MNPVPTPGLPTNPEGGFEIALIRTLSDLLGRYARAINILAGGGLDGTVSSATIPTTAGSIGDIVRNSAPAVLGTAGSQYILIGWIYGSDSVWHTITHLTDG